MSEQQQQRVHFYHQDDGSSSSESRSEAPHCPSMEGSASMDQSINTPTPPGGGSVDRIWIEWWPSMQSVAIPLPPVASAALPPQPLPINNLERMKMVVIPIPPSMAPAPNMDQLERMHNAAIPHAPSSRMEMMDAQPQPSLNTDHPQQSTSTEVTDSQRQPCMITGEDINQGEEPDHGHTVDFGDMPTLEECQALEWVELAMSDVDDDFLRALHMFKSQHGAGFPPLNIPYDKDLDRHIMQAMQWISADIQHLVRSRVQHVEAGQYTVDMIDLLEVSQHPHVGYSLQPYTGGPPYPSQQSVIEMAIVYLGCCIECVVIHLLEGAGSPHTGDCIAGKFLSIVSSMFPGIPVMPRGPEFQQMRGTRIFPIAHEYFQHTWPLQQLSMGDQIDEWMEEKVSAYMIMVRSVAGWTYGVKYIMEFQLTDVHFATCNPGIVIIVPGLYQNRRLRVVGSEPPGQMHTYKGGSLSMLPFRSAISRNNAMSVCHQPIREGFMLSFSGTAILLSEFQICLWDEGEFPAMWEFQVSYLMFTI
ncbi:hypothetical protein F5141DRAFT_1065263 [Pisolithus sp. B1]|nr:hypothetical protein F5141DRAFT_1065263 [Pisolithus sp. B1]